MTVTRSSENFNKIQVGTNAYIGPDAVANAADFANAQMYVKQGDTGSSSTSYVGVASEALAVNTEQAGIAFYGVGKAAGNKDGRGILAKGTVTATGDTATATGGYFVSTDTHAGGTNVGVLGDAQNGAANYSFYGANGDFLNKSGKAIFNDDGTNAADFALAQMYVLEGDSGGTSAFKFGIVGESAALVANPGVGVSGYGKTSSNASGNGVGLMGVGTVDATGDAGGAFGVIANANSTHAGGTNYAIYSDARNSDVNNYSFYGAAGDIYNAGRILGYKGSDVASANDITLGQGNFFLVTGTTTVQRILGAGWTAGSVVTLYFADNIQIDHNVAAGGGYYGILLEGAGGNFSATASDTLTIIFSADKWREIS